MNRTRLVTLCIATCGAAAAAPSDAVCLDPATLVSGYRVPLPEELRTSDNVVIGQVLALQALHEELRDPQGVTATVYSVRVLRDLKGRTPSVIALRVENDSGRYVMQAGEEHLLLLQRHPQGLWVNSCGNSSALPRGNAVLHEVEAAMRP